MKLLILGSTGATGQEMVKRALSEGHQVVAYARSPNKFDDSFTGQITIVTGELTDEQALLQALDGVDAVVSALGPIRNPSPGLPVTDGYKTIVKCMKQKNVKRLVALSTGSYKDKENDKFSLVPYLMVSVVKLFFNYGYQEVNGSAEVITNTDLDWTLFRVNMLNDNPASTVKTAYVGQKGINNVSRKDIAVFAIDEVQNNSFVRKSPIIYSE